MVLPSFPLGVERFLVLPRGTAGGARAPAPTGGRAGVDAESDLGAEGGAVLDAREAGAAARRNAALPPGRPDGGRGDAPGPHPGPLRAWRCRSAQSGVVPGFALLPAVR